MDVKTIITKNCRVACCSLVWFKIPAFPHNNGNYFSMIVEDVDYRIINMWRENFEEAVKRFGVDELTFEIFFDKVAIIKSDKIPKDWFMEELFMEYNVDLTSEQKDAIIKYVEAR